MRPLAGDKNPLRPEEKLHLVAEYDGGIAADDHAISEIVGYLRMLGLYDKTLIVVTSDHGEGLLEHGLLDHELATVYQTHLHVPLLIKYPEQKEASRSDALVSQVDLMPTILEQARIAVAEGLQGRSLRNVPPNDDSAVFAVARATLKGHPTVRGTRRAVLSGNLKLITWTFGPPEAYDLASDAGEQRNIYSTEDRRILELSKRLMEFNNRIPVLKPQTPSMDPAALDRLKSLGYVQ